MRRLLLLGLLLGAGCSSDRTPDAVRTYRDLVRGNYEDAAQAAKGLDTAIQALVAQPSAQTLEAARSAWKAAREPYLQTEVFRFYDGPIDRPSDGPEGLINAWPMDENYVDYTEGMPAAGIINDTGRMIDAAALEALNEQGGEKNIATGFHPIEFLLWGQDLSESGPGARPHTDYVTPGGTAANQERRGRYLRAISQLLVGHLEAVRDQWAEKPGSYATELSQIPPAQALERILTGLIVLSGFELGGERLQTALDSGDQEDEHSCFSDTTHRDMYLDALGIENIYLGRYRRTGGALVTGVGIHDLVAEKDAGLADRLKAQVQQSVSLAQALVPPFDREIAPGNAAGRARVQALIDSLRAQEKLLQEVFQLYGFTVKIPE